MLVLVLSCRPDATAVTAGAPGTPLPDLTGDERARFFAGMALFDKVFTPEEGLGPFFNENQCSACHTVPAIGGTTGFERVVKASSFIPPTSCDQLAGDGGENVRTQAVPALRAHGVERQAHPPGATNIGRFTPPFLFGLGLLEAIPESDIVRREDPNDENNDGISGRAGRARDGRLARFGRKADFVAIRDFVVDALRQEMGLTTPDQAAEDVLGGLPSFAALDARPDPDLDEAGVASLTTFVRFLAPPEQATPRSPAHQDSIEAGQSIFREIRCEECHTPTMRSGAEAVRALDRKTVALYSDLLLHDMGPGLTNVCTRDATPTELRTTPLMGLRHRDRLLHDGRTGDLRDAILAHGGEATTSRDAFARLSWSLQEYLLQFLRSL